MLLENESYELTSIDFYFGGWIWHKRLENRFLKMMKIIVRQMDSGGVEITWSVEVWVRLFHVRWLFMYLKINETRKWFDTVLAEYIADHE